MVTKPKTLFSNAPAVYIRRHKTLSAVSLLTNSNQKHYLAMSLQCSFEDTRLCQQFHYLPIHLGFLCQPCLSLRAYTTYPNTSGTALLDGVGHSGTGRVDHGDEAGEAEARGGEVHLIRVEVEAALVLLLIQVQVTETCSGEYRSWTFLFIYLLCFGRFLGLYCYDRIV